MKTADAPSNVSQFLSCNRKKFLKILACKNIITRRYISHSVQKMSRTLRKYIPFKYTVKGIMRKYQGAAKHKSTLRHKTGY